jgi:CDP-diacylglycerol--serine O-phosphatidyltransferase
LAFAKYHIPNKPETRNQKPETRNQPPEAEPRRRRKTETIDPLKHFPNLLTLTNLVLGCLALVYIVEEHVYITLSEETAEGERFISALGLGRLNIACILVLVAAVVDLLDGLFARLLRAESEMGKHLDSLADMVTFGLVPGMIMYHLLAISWFASSNTFQTPVLLFLPAFVITLSAAWRLARYNISGRSARFTGLPTPAAAIVIASLPLAAHLSESGFDTWIANKWIMYCITLALAALMISRLPMAKMGAGHATWIFIGMCALVLAIGYFALGLLFSLVPALVMLYILFSLFISSSSRRSETVNP